MVIGIIFIIAIVITNKQLKMVGAYSGFVFGMLHYYSVVPILLMLNIDMMSTRFSSINLFVANKGTFNFVYAAIVVTIGFVFFSIFYKLSIRKNFRLDYKGVYWKFNDVKAKKALLFFSFLTLIIGGLSFLILTISIGGIIQLLKVAEMNRSFAISLDNFTNFPQLMISSRLITVSPFLFLLLLLNKQNRKLRYIFFFSISFIMSILFFLFNAGRAPLITFLLCFIFIFIRKYFRKPWTVVIMSGIIALPILDISDAIFKYITSFEWEKTNIDYSNYLYQFIFPFKNILNLTEIVSTFGYRYGIDFITSFISILPGVNMEASYENTSQYFAGGNWKAVGGVPNDPITFGYIQFNIIGVITVFSIIGYIFGKIDKAILKLPTGKFKDLVSATVVTGAFLLVSSADLVAVLRGNVILILLSIIIIYSTKNKVDKIYKTNE